MAEVWLMKVHSFVWEPHCLYFSVKLFNIHVVICLLHFRLLTQMLERSQSQLKSLRWGSPWVIRTLIDKSHSLLDVLTAGMLCRRWTGRGRQSRWAESWSVVWEQLTWWSLLSSDHRRSTTISTGEPVRCETVDQLCKDMIIPPSSSHSWNTLVHKNFEIERACLDLETESYQLRQEAKERLVCVVLHHHCCGCTIVHTSDILPLLLFRTKQKEGGWTLSHVHAMACADPTFPQTHTHTEASLWVHKHGCWLDTKIFPLPFLFCF